jgi:serine/threonine protein kinase/Flp pilus assembly protein TadD
VDAKGKRVCQVCGAALRDDSDSCPICALRGALGTETTSLSDSSSELRFEHYQVLKNKDRTPVELGRGAMGVTYKAIDVNLRSVVALKVIGARFIGDDSARRRFVREARAAASVRHPNVAWVIHLGESGGNYFYVMEFVDGESLDKVIRRSSRLDTSTTLKVVTLVAAGLEAIQKQNLVHRDIKPSNIMVSLEGNKVVNAKIIDLGLAKGAPEDEAFLAISIQGAFAGTPQYASPEQFAGVGADIRSDLYSLGITLWEMLIGQTPFRGSPTEVMYQHQQEPLPIEQLKGVPQPVIALLEVLLEKDPARRLRNPADLLNALPKVSDAVKARRIVTHQTLREITDERLGASGKEIEVLTNLREALAGRRVRMILWSSIMLVIAGGAILGMNIFFGSKHPSTQASKNSFPAVAAPEKSIAVLPFESLSENKSDSYFADGIQDEILSNLAKVSQLRVISRTSVMTFRPDSNRDLRSIATALDVAHVLEGTVRRYGNRVRITTELIDADKDKTLWSDSYDRDLTDIFAIQSEIAQTVVAKLSAELSAKEKQEIEGEPTDSLEAYDLYLQAKELIANTYLFHLKTPRENFLKAIGYLEEATKRDTKFALAYCLLTGAHDSLYFQELDTTPERRALGDAAVAEALRLRPDLPETHLAAAFHRYTCYRDYERARVQIAIAQRSLPNNPKALALTAYLDRRQGRWVQSTIGLEKAVSLDPRNREFLSELANNYLSLRRYRDYEHTYDRLIQLEPDKPALALQRARSTLYGNGDLANYREVLERFPSTMRDDFFGVSRRFADALNMRDWTTAKEILSRNTNAEFYYFNADRAVPRGCLEAYLVYLQGGRPAMEGQFAAAREQLNREVAAHPEDPSLLAGLGVVDAALGRKPEAIEEAKRAVEMLPVSEDAVDGPPLLYNQAAVYAMVNECDLAFKVLDLSAKIPGGVSYGEMKLDPCWDRLRKDPRFDELLAEIAPKD